LVVVILHLNHLARYNICALIRFSRESFLSVDIRLIGKSMGLWNCSGLDC